MEHLFTSQIKNQMNLNYEVLRLFQCLKRWKVELIVLYI